MVRRLLVTALVVATVLFGSFFVRSVVRSGEIMPRVSAGGVELGGMDPDEATAAIVAHEAKLAVTPLAISVAGTSIPFTPAQGGFSFQAAEAVAAAAEAGRDTPLQQFRDWLTRRSYQMELTASFDIEALEALFGAWEDAAMIERPSNGAIRINAGEIEFAYPAPGQQIDRDRATGILVAAMEDPGTRQVTLPLTEAQPALVPSDIDAARRELASLLAGPITLFWLNPPTPVVFQPEELGDALLVSITDEGIETSFDPDALDVLLGPLWNALAAPPRDAQFLVTADDRVIIVPGARGTEVDRSALESALREAAATRSRTGTFSYTLAAEPDFTTEDAVGLGITGLVAEFTTEYRCCEPRVQNIQRMADLVDGAIVRPGEQFSLNGWVGPRTEEEGFVEAPMILYGEFVPSIGGGVSQFATTLYNAVFFGGYADVFHQPHSYWFSRYPEGREATVSWPNPDLIFGNDTGAGVLLKTEYDDTSVTVKLFGENGGRTVAADLSPRRAFRSPPTIYEADSSVEPGTEIVDSRGRDGWTVTVTRTITSPDGDETIEEFDWAYRPEPRRVRVHPCEIPESEATCPTTTTSTTTTSTTSTTTTSTTSTTTPSTTTTTTAGDQ
jgi:vancomycin resistance protein YoaR